MLSVSSFYTITKGKRKKEINTHFKNLKMNERISSNTKEDSVNKLKTKGTFFFYNTSSQRLTNNHWIIGRYLIKIETSIIKISLLEGGFNICKSWDMKYGGWESWGVASRLQSTHKMISVFHVSWFTNTNPNK